MCQQSNPTLGDNYHPRTAAAHRDHATCAACHRQIDPLGFALENFDPPAAGVKRSWPARLGDAAGKWRGKPFRDIVELKAILSKHQDEVARHLADRLLAYGTGRRSSWRRDYR